MATHTLLTADELFALPDDGHRHELIRGELTTMTPPGFRHGLVASAFNARLAGHVRDHDLGAVTTEVGFRLADDPDTVRAPDVAFITRERVEQVGETERYWPGPPDLAVEVVSPNDRYAETHDKALEWLAAGARLVLVVDPAEQRITAYRSPSSIVVLAGDEPLDLGDVVPGFAVPAQALFG